VSSDFVTEQRDDQSPLALAYQWSARITSISLELLLPMLLGLWLDRRWGTLPLLLIVGVILGFLTATLSLLRLAKPPGSGRPPD
jgi:ATP synthase protein I